MEAEEEQVRGREGKSCRNCRGDEREPEEE
jgi:hypothetical protein